MFSVYLWSVYTGYGDVCFLYDPSNMASVSFEDNGSAHNTKRRKLKNYLAPGALFVFLLLVPVYIFPLQSTMSQSFHSIPSLNASNRTAQYWFVFVYFARQRREISWGKLEISTSWTEAENGHRHFLGLDTGFQVRLRRGE